MSRRDTRHHQAASIKEVNQSTFKEKDKTWIQCCWCDDWLYEETYFKASWAIGPSTYRPAMYYTSWSDATFRVCNACCHTALDVVDYLEGLTKANKESYDKSYKQHLKDEKKKEKEALTIVDGKSYSFTFKETVNE